MYKVTNIILSRSSSALHHLPDGMSPDVNPFGYEPWIAGMQLKLGEERILTNEQYKASKEVISSLIGSQVISLEYLPEPNVSIEQESIQPEVSKDVQVFEIGVPLDIIPEPLPEPAPVIAEPMVDEPAVEEVKTEEWKPSGSVKPMELNVPKKKKK